MATQKQIDRWCEEAREMGADAAEAAISWLSFDNDDDARKLRQMLDNGDPRADEYLPRYPDLSGEWADDPTPLSIARYIVGEDQLDDEDPELIDWLADAWDDGVADAWDDAIYKRIEEYLSA